MKKKNNQRSSHEKGLNKNNDEDDIINNDERFAAAMRRPQFNKTKNIQSSNKIVLDERFAPALKDSRFRVDVKDKYGRSSKNKKKKKKKRSKKKYDNLESDDGSSSDDSDGAENELAAFYTVEKSENKKRSKDENESDDGGDESDSNGSEIEEKNEEGSTVASTDDDDSDDNDDEDPASRIAYLTALSRGEISASSSSSDSSDDSDSGDESSIDGDSDLDDDHHKQEVVGVLDPSSSQKVATAEGEEDDNVVPITTVPSPYMAVLSMDWTHVRAVDLFAIISSFTQPGSIRRVQIYPSDFGMERMRKEARYGPSDLWKDNNGSNKDADGDQVNSDNNEQVEDDDHTVNSNNDDSDDNDDGGDNGDDIDIDIGEEFDEDDNLYGSNNNHNVEESDFDTEKLRAYEASKLKYYFAIVEFVSPESADIAYREIDGLELEHSSAAMDLRSIPPDDIEGVTANRKLRDEATSVPSNYEPPNFVVNALQQTSVQCTWEDGDAEREQKLTGYGGTNWSQIAEGDDLRAYLASDVSSDEDEDDNDSDNEVKGSGSKRSDKRKLLGLDSGDEEDSESNDSDDESGDDDDNNFGKEISFIPGKRNLEDKIRSKLDQSKKNIDEPKELTPWEKYQQKRKEKRKERKRAARNKRKGILEENSEEDNEHDDKIDEAKNDDDVFLDSNESSVRKDKVKGGRSKSAREDDRRPSSKEELELLLAGDHSKEDERDYDMRGLQRIDKNRDKKLRGSRKRKEKELASNVSGTEFKIDTKDDRFAAVLEGTDGRFGIDRTDPNFKETPAMREILETQTKRRRKAKKRKKNEKKDLVAPDVIAGSAPMESSDSGAMALSSLVKSLKSRVAGR